MLLKRCSTLCHFQGLHDSAPLHFSATSLCGQEDSLYITGYPVTYSNPVDVEVNCDDCLEPVSSSRPPKLYCVGQRVTVRIHPVEKHVQKTPHQGEPLNGLPPTNGWADRKSESGHRKRPTDLLQLRTRRLGWTNEQGNKVDGT